MVRAIGGERSPVKERTSARMKRIFASRGIDGKRVTGPAPERVTATKQRYPKFTRILVGYSKVEIIFCSYGCGGSGAGAVFTGAGGCVAGEGFSEGAGTDGTAGAFGAAGLAGVFGSEETSAMIFSVAALLTAQAESQMRHWARVNLQPQVQVSALKRWRTNFFCSGVSFVRSTPGSSVARSACDRKTSPLSSNVSTFAMMGMPSRARISVS